MSYRRSQRNRRQPDRFGPSSPEYHYTKDYYDRAYDPEGNNVYWGRRQAPTINDYEPPESESESINDFIVNDNNLNFDESDPTYVPQEESNDCLFEDKYTLVSEENEILRTELKNINTEKKRLIIRNKTQHREITRNKKYIENLEYSQKYFQNKFDMLNEFNKKLKNKNYKLKIILNDRNNLILVLSSIIIIFFIIKYYPYHSYYISLILCLIFYYHKNYIFHLIF